MKEVQNYIYNVILGIKRTKFDILDLRERSTSKSQLKSNDNEGHLSQQYNLCIIGDVKTNRLYNILYDKKVHYLQALYGLV